MADHNHFENFFLKKASPDLFLNNPFKILNVSIDASSRDIKRHLEKMELRAKLKASVENDKDAGADHSGVRTDLNQVKAAAQCLNDPEIRLVNEFFWYWPQTLNGSDDDQAIQLIIQGDIDAAVQLWLQAASSQKNEYIRTHNLAVYYQAKVFALEREQEKDHAENTIIAQQEYQEKAGQLWRDLIEMEAFWSRFSDRIRAIDDPRLTTGISRRFRKHLPLIILLMYARISADSMSESNLQKARRFKNFLETWPNDDQAKMEACLEAVQPVRSRMRTISDSLLGEAQNDIIHAKHPLSQLIDNTIIRRSLETVDLLLYLPEHEPIREGIHDHLAERIRACIQQFGNETELWEETVSLLEKADWIPQSSIEKENYQEAVSQARKNAQGDFRWRHKGYFDLPPHIVEVLENAREDFHFEQWDQAIAKIEGLFKKYPNDITVEDQRIIYKPLALCLTVRAMNRLNQAFEKAPRLPQTLLTALRNLSKNPGLQIYSNQACAACGIWITGSYYRYEVKGGVIKICNTCDKNIKFERNQIKKNLQVALSRSARDLLYAQALDPENEMIQENLQKVRKESREAGLSLPKRPDLPGKDRAAPKKSSPEEACNTKKQKRAGLAITISLAVILIVVTAGLRFTAGLPAFMSRTPTRTPFPTRTAASQPSVTPTPVLTSTPSPLPYWENFESTPKDWYTGSLDEGTVQIEEEMYVFDLDKDTEVALTNGAEMKDATISVETYHIEGSSETTGSSIWFRADKEMGYGLYVFGDGSFMVVNDTGDTIEEIVPLGYHVDVKNYWHQPNQWEIIMEDSTFRVICNGTEVAEFIDASHQSGKLFLGALSYSNSRVKVGFDNLYIEQ
jgi:hypothetical protein